MLLPAEAAHRVTIVALRSGLVPKLAGPDDPVLTTRVWGLDFANPLGVAAGFDKDAEAVDGLLAMGFGFVEVGTVTPDPQPGNPKPRVFRLPEDRAVINRLGFNSRGLAPVVGRLERRLRARRAGIVGANVGMNQASRDAAADYAVGVEALAGLADYLVMNVSSPNTPGLRELQARPRLIELIQRVQAARARAAGAREGGGAPGPPLLLKIAPDLSDDELRDMAEVALETGLDGLVVTNTTVARPKGLKGRHRREPGGLSGAPLFERSTEVLREMHRLTQGRVPLVGVGGVASGPDAYAKIRAGASLVQLYTALIYEGPGLVGRIKAELAEVVRADGFERVGDAVGADA
jgi:dihydroorotate dehydrogenase